MKTVPVVIYENGVRKVIGQAVVDMVDGYITVDAKVNPEDTKLIEFDKLKHLSLGPFKAPTQNTIEE